MSDARRAVFLSYASQDAEPAKRICESLRSAGVPVWFDTEGGLEHGDEWDAKIRQQIKDCVLFVAIISANTQAREEGYFRIEWELAAERAMGIASGTAFILPIVIDETREPDALVPDRFRKVQWTRAPSGAVTPDVQVRFLKLWSHRTGALNHETKATNQRHALTDTNARSSPEQKPSLARWAPTAVLVLVVAGIGAWFIAQKQNAPSSAASAVSTESSVKPSDRPATPVSATTSSASAPAHLTPARELMHKALPLLRGLDSTREDFALADEYCVRALKLDPDDGEIWAIHSQLCSAFVYRGWDASAERREQVRITAERAIRLAPNSAEARLAQAGSWSTFNVNRDEREKLLRDIVREQPNHQNALRFLAVTVLARPGGLAECLELNERSAALPGGDSLALFNNSRYLWQAGRRAEAYDTLKRSIAQKPFISAYALATSFEIGWRGDLAAAEASFRHIPEAMLLEERVNYVAGLLSFYRRRPDEAIERWRSFPRDYYTDFVYDGPKGFLMGAAHELAHRTAAAETEWRMALQLVDKRIAATPNSSRPYLHRAMLLGCLGDKVAGSEALKTYEQLAGLTYTAERPMTAEMATVYIRLGRFEDIFAFPPAPEVARMLIDPRFDALRADPRFEKWAVTGSKLGSKPSL